MPLPLISSHQLPPEQKTRIRSTPHHGIGPLAAHTAVLPTWLRRTVPAIELPPKLTCNWFGIVLLGQQAVLPLPEPVPVPVPVPEPPPQTSPPPSAVKLTVVPG